SSYLRISSLSCMISETQILCLYQTISCSSSTKSCALPTLICCLISSIFSSSSCPLRMSCSRVESTSITAASVLLTIPSFNLSNSLHKVGGTFSNVNTLQQLLRLTASPTTFAFPG